MDQSHKPRSSSHSPLLNRRPSLKEKAGTSTGISKSKKKTGTNVKKERWLLTRKTWRYMTDAVGNLLPEHHGGGGSSSNKGGGSGTDSRRQSSSFVSTPILSERSSPSPGSWGGGGTVDKSSTFWGEGGVDESRSNEYESGTLILQQQTTKSGIVPEDDTTLLQGGNYGRSVLQYSRTALPQEGLAESTTTIFPTTRQSIARSSICGGSGHIEDPESIPRLEKRFEQACNKEKKFLLWTRTGPKRPSGPALRDLKLKEKLRGGSKKGIHEGEQIDTVSGMPRNRTPSSSSIRRFGGRDGVHDSSKEHLLEYYSPEEDMMDDDYDEYGDEQAMVKDSRRKSSAASSILSLVSGGLSFFKMSQTVSAFATSGTSPIGVVACSPPDSGAFSRTMPGTGMVKYFRHAGIQTEPFPEEILIRLRLQSVQEEQLIQQQHLIHKRYGRDSDLPVKEQEGELHHILIPVEKTMPDISSTTTTSQNLNLVSVSPREFQDPTRCSTDIDPKVVNKGGGAQSPTSPEVIADQTDKKSEESGYSSSISDTVMRYLRMARKNSKADNKETIDKFKTVNYDRSLRYIKSKNVTVEEALEHEKNKALLAQQKQQGALTDERIPEVPPIVSPPISPPTPPKTSPPTSTKAIPPSTLVISGPKTGSKTVKVKKSSGKHSKKRSPATSPISPQEVIQTVSDATTGGFPGPTSPTGFPTSSAGPSPPITPTSPLGGISMTSSPPVSQVQTPTTPASISIINQFNIPVVPIQPPASIGIQAGESLIRFLRNFNPARKFSDFSSAASYGSSESPPVEVTSPRYSISTTVLSSNSDNELYQQQLVRHEFQNPQQHHQHPPNLPSYFGGTGTGRSSLVDSSTSYSGADSGEFENQIFSSTNGGHEKRHSNTSSISTSSTTGHAYCSPLSTTTTTTATMILKKSSSSQQIQPILRDPRDSSLSTLYSHHILPTTRGGGGGGLGGGVSSLSVSSTPGTLLTSLSAPHVNVSSSSLSCSAPYITSKGSPSLSLSTSSTHSDYPQYSPRATTMTFTTPISTMTNPSSSTTPTQRSSFNFLSSFRNSTKRHSSSHKSDKTHSSSSTSISSFLRRTSSGSTKQQQQQQQQQNISSSLTLSSSTPIPTPSVSFKEGLLGYSYNKRDLGGNGSGGRGSGGGGGGGSSSSHETTTYDSSNLSGTCRIIDSSSSLVMQKSKSSSSVLHQHHGQSPSGSTTTEKRGSACSATGGGILSSQTAAAASRLMSKSRIFKSRSKSQTRGSGGGAGGSCTWTPQGKCKWTNVSGKQVTVESTTVLHLSETERVTLQKVALAKLQALNLGVDVKIPREKIGSSTKPKRRPYLLKKKALSTGFFDSGNKRDEGKEVGGSGMVFGIPLSQCLTNDQQRRGVISGTSGISSPGPPDWEQSSGTHKRSQNGSRNSVSSVCEPSIYNKGDNKMGSTESLVWGKRESCAALDSISCSSGDLLGENIIPVSSAIPAIVSTCIRHLENYGLHTTGIFRVSTSLKRIRQLREEIDSGKDVQFDEEQNPHDVAALLKEFLRDLPEPLLCRDLYQAFLRTQKIRNRRLQMEAVQHLIQLLPVPNRDTLAALLKFFAKVVENAGDTRTRTGEVLMGNKMEGYSLATLIAPNILPCIPTEGSITLDHTATQTKERRESIDVVNYMISNYKELFEVPAELLDEIYIHMMDTHPEIIEDILKQKGGLNDDAGLDELETTSSVFEGSECGDPGECEEQTVVTSVRKFQKREEILHKDGGKGGQPDFNRGERSRFGRDGSKERSTDFDKQQSGAESDSSSTKSTSRWFRRGRTDHKSRTSSDSGSEKVRGKAKRDPSLHEGKRASSLDSVNLKESPASPSTTLIVTETVVERQRSCSDQSLKVPENLSRRQSSPVLEGTGIITASLKIPVPVPLNIDDTDIPFIEDDNSGETISQQIGQYQASTRSTRARSTYTDSSTYARNTPTSTHTNSPLSSPLRQPSSEVSSPATFSPPNSPPYDDSNTFPYEELTLRFCLGPPLCSTSGGSQNQQQSPTVAVSKSASAVITSSTIYQPSTSSLGAVCLGSSMYTKTVKTEEIPTTESESKDTAPTSISDVKGLGRETKGAKIAGLIKSKTADFEKFAKDSQVGPSAIASNMRLRSQGNIQLKQQFLLRQHDKFQQQNPGRSSISSSNSSSSGVVLGPEGLVNSGSRSLQRRKNLAASSSAIIGTTSSDIVSNQSSEKDKDKEKTIDISQKPSSSSYNSSKSTGSMMPPSTTTITSSSSASGSPSRWKRSEIISSQHRGSSTSSGERETFF